MSIVFKERKKGHMTGWTTKTDDKISIDKVGKEWVLTIKEERTDAILHTFTAPFQYRCCQEACRYFSEGAFAKQPC